MKGYKTYPHAVIADGKFYFAGEPVPDSSEAPEEKETKAVAPETPTKTQESEAPAETKEDDSSEAPEEKETKAAKSNATKRTSTKAKAKSGKSKQ